MVWLLQHLQNCRYDCSSHSRWGFNCLKLTTTHVQCTHCFIFGLERMFTCQTTEKVIQIVMYTNHIWEEIKFISTLSPLQNLVRRMKLNSVKLAKPWGEKSTHPQHEAVWQGITKVLSASKCHQTIKTKHLSLKQMTCTDIVYKNLNSNFIGHSVGIQPVGLCRNIWMLLLVQLLHVEIDSGTGITNWTIQDRICLRDEIF